MMLKFIPKWHLKNCLSILLIFGMLCAAMPSYAQGSHTISGKVIDGSELVGLIGANILEKGTSNGTSADLDGSFSLDVAGPDAILVISFTGFISQEVSLGGRTNLEITLSEDSQTLDEVVVVGYGSVKKSDLTGAVNSLGTKEITMRNVTSPIEAVQGSIPGVNITSNTGRIGDGFNINIRGANSLIGQTQPLIIVDGVPTGTIDFLNPQDIERIDVLKDASSAAIYGSRGASGVILITTKGGKSAKPGMSVSFESSFGVKEVTRLPQFMTGAEWWAYHQVAYLNQNNPLGDTPEGVMRLAGNGSPELVKRAERDFSFDWFDAVLKSGVQLNNYLSIAGNSGNGLNYNIGFGLQNETGNIEKESIDKYTLNAGLTHRVSDKFTAGLNLSLSAADEELGSNLAMQEAFRLSPLATPWAVDENGTELIGELFFQPGKLTYPNGQFAFNKTSSLNPLVEIANSSQDIKTNRTIGNLFLQYNPLSWLSVKTSFSTGSTDRRLGSAFGAESNAGIARNQTASSQIDNRKNFNYTWDNQFNIDHKVGTDHSFSFLGLHSMYSNRTETSFLYSHGQPFETGIYNIGSGAQTTFNAGSSYVKNTLLSFAGRLNYAFKDRYLVTASNRWDGSSVLSTGNKWASFPSLAFAWKLKGEDFLKNNSLVNDLKVRASIGYTGNDNVSPYTTLNQLPTQTFYDYNGTTSNGWIASSLSNSQLSWEKTRELNFGIDFGILDYRITGSIDIYDRLSDDLIAAQTLPRETGAGVTFANVGSVSNKGVEVLLSADVIRTSNVTWKNTITFSKNTNKLESLYGQSEVDDIGNGWFIGESLNNVYNYTFDGVWQAEESDLAASYKMKEGQARPLDINNDGVFNGDDRSVLGHTDPSWSGALNSNLIIGNFDFIFSAITNQGGTVLSRFHDNFGDTADRGRQKLAFDSYYVPANGAGLPEQRSNTNPRPRGEGAFWRSNFAFIRDVSFVKVKNIGVGYTLSSEKLNINRARVYANVLNPFVFTDYDGWDPEWGGAALGIGRVASITYQMGLSLNF